MPIVEARLIHWPSNDGGTANYKLCYGHDLSED